MASIEKQAQLLTAQRAYAERANSPQTMQVVDRSPETRKAFLIANELATKSFQQIEPYLPEIDDQCLEPLITFLLHLSRAVQSPDVGETFQQAINKARSNYVKERPIVTSGILDCSGFLAFAPVRLEERGAAILATINDASEKLSQQSKEAADAIEGARRTASKISVEAAQMQFQEAACGLNWKVRTWMGITLILFLALTSLLWRLTWHPPLLIQQIVDAMKPGFKIPEPGQVSVPLLIAASAYFTSIRLAMVGVLGIGLAFSLRMTRAYLHMIEHNQHKLRVTNSIEAFVAAVRTDEQKDLVLGKLVESVTDFGESGILSKQGDTSGLPSIIIDSMTKNVGKQG